MENVKTCTKCGKELPLDQFRQVRHRSGNIGYRSECVNCAKIIAAKYRENNIEKVRASYATKMRESPDKIRAYCAKWRYNNPEYAAKWYRSNLEKRRAADAEWRKNNPEKARRRAARWYQDNKEHINKRVKKRKSIDVEFKLICNLRAAINSALRGNYKSGHTIELLGCSIEYLRSYLEVRFTEGMSWDNYGSWHIDHIIPLSYFDMSDPEQQKRAWHYTNLQPLWAVDNLKKSNKIEERQLVLL